MRRLQIQSVRKVKLIVYSTGGVAALYVLGVGALFASNVLLAREVSKANFGEYSFFKQTSLFLMAFAFLGFDQAVIRKVSRGRLDDVAWKHLWVKIIGLSSIITILGSIFIGFFYELSFGTTILLGITTIAMTSTLLSTSLFRSGQRFIEAQFFQNLWRYLWFIIILSVLLFQVQFNTNIITAFCFTVLISSIVSIIALMRNDQNPEEKIRLGELYQDAVIFWLIISSLALVTSLDVMMLGKMASLNDVGTYSAIWTVVGAPFIVLAASIGYVGLPMVVRGTLSSILDKKILIPMSAIVLIGAVIWSILSPKVIEIVYAGKYSPEQTLIELFIIAGVIVAFYSIPSVMLGGKADWRLLLRFLAFAIMGLCIHFTLNLLLIPLYGVVGAAFGFLSNWIVRCSGGMWLTFRYKNSLASYQPATEDI